MTETLRNLEHVEPGYAVFEKDQVLTPEQLNSLSGYLDDQQRLTRVALLGVGIACGLWPLLEGQEVSLSHGVGATTDGDLVFIGDDILYDRYKPYDEAAPKYKPFYRGGTMIPAFELVPKDKDDERARPLSRFGEEDRKLEAMVAVLLVESHLHDPDICTGTDCDNRGLKALHKTRLLLVDAKSAALLAIQLDTPDRAARTPLEPVVADRVVLPAALSSEGELAALYRKACAAIHDGLVDALAALYKSCKPLFDELALRDPAAQWRKALEIIRGGVKDRGIQYYYDFLKDLAETNNDLLDVLFGDTTVCCPDVDAFPKHLVLGALEPRLRSASGRTGFYPSPMVSATAGQRAHARFLIRKLDTLIGSFDLPAQAAEIRITPSAFEDRCLEQRAIPFYYAPRENLPPVHLVWNFALSKKGMERYNYSYHADRYDAAGGAKKPFASQIGAFDFFRIEGHLGWDVRKAASVLRGQIKQQNLPIDVETVLLGAQRGQVVFDPPLRNFDLYRWRHLMRTDIAGKLDDVVDYSKKFAAQVAQAVGDKVIGSEDVGEPIELPGYASNQSIAIEQHAKKASEKILRADYDMNSKWQDDVMGAATIVAEFRQKLSPVTKFEFFSPLDNLLGGQQERWLGWLDILIRNEEEKEADRLMLSTYLAQHPGLEHYAGVLRGGMFVLVHDGSGTVVADFMLPYNCCVRRDQPLQLPPLVRPPKPPSLAFDNPIRLIPFPDKFRFDKFRDDVRKGIQEDIEVHKNYFNIFKEVTLAASGVPKPGPTMGGGLPLGNPMLDLQMDDIRLQTRKVDQTRAALLEPTLPAGVRSALETRLQQSEEQLATTILDATQAVADAGLGVAAGSDAFKVMSEVSSSSTRIANPTTLNRVTTGLNAIGEQTSQADLKTVIANVMPGRVGGVRAPSRSTPRASRSGTAGRKAPARRRK